jgi:hypothetical protein
MKLGPFAGNEGICRLFFALAAGASATTATPGARAGMKGSGHGQIRVKKATVESTLIQSLFMVAQIVLERVHRLGGW